MSSVISRAARLGAAAAAVLCLIGPAPAAELPKPAEAAAAEPAKPKAPPVRYKTYRYDEDYRFLKEPDAPARFWDAIKLIGLGDGTTLTLGGDLRARHESIDAARFGLGGGRADSYWLHRLMLHADLHAGDWFRVFGQIAFLEAAGKLAPASYDQTHWDIGQAFIDVGPLFARGKDGFGLRIGRQEMSFGPRVMVVRDAFNWRARYDGVRLAWAGEGWRIDAVAAQPVLELPLAWDDEANDARELYGLRVEKAFAETAWKASVGLWHLTSDNVRFGTRTADDKRWTLEARIEGKQGPWDLDAELLFQWGEFGPQDISAWGFIADGGYSFAETPWKPRIGMRLYYGTGDSNVADNEVGDFQPPFGSTAYFNQGLFIGYPNTTLVGFVAGVKPTATLSVDVRYDMVWRNTASDSIYAGTGALPGTLGRPGSDRIGGVPGIQISWKPVPETTFFLYAAQYNVSGALEASGARDATYVAASVAFQF